MRRQHAHPVVFLLLSLPKGIPAAFIIVIVPFLARSAGVPVATVATMVAVGLSPKVGKLILAPAVDAKFTLKAWYRIGMLITAASLVLLGFVPITPKTVWPVTGLAFISEIAVNVAVVALVGLMAVTLPDNLKGRAAGWLESGGTISRALGGGVGLWIATHTPNPGLAPVALGIFCLVCMAGLHFVTEPEREMGSREFAPRLLEIGREIVALVRSPIGAVVIALLLTPIGLSGISNFWSGVAVEWHVSAGMVAVVTGALGAVAGAIGCVLAGWWADHADRGVVFLATGGLLAFIGIVLALAPRTPLVFATGSFAQTMALGMCDAAASAIAFAVIGRRAAATKMAIASGLGNIPNLYMTAFSGWVHDRAGTAAMLEVEGLIIAVCILVGIGALHWVAARGGQTLNGSGGEMALATPE